MQHADAINQFVERKGVLTIDNTTDAETNTAAADGLTAIQQTLHGR